MSPKHHIKEITGKMRLLCCNMIVLEGRYELDRIHLLQMLAGERNSCNDF